ncbi:MAG: hypothetical protein ABR609_10050 [Acidimicrobiia bacterium]
MSSGSYPGPGREDIGSRPGGFNAWELFQLGWLSYDVAFAGETSNTSQHPGAGLILLVDSRPRPLIAPNGAPWRARVQMYDATFGLEKTDALTLSFQAGSVQYGPTTYRSQPAVSTFTDLKSWWSPQAPLSSVIVPKTGTVIQVMGVAANGGMNIQVRPAA